MTGIVLYTILTYVWSILSQLVLGDIRVLSAIRTPGEPSYVMNCKTEIFKSEEEICFRFRIILCNNENFYMIKIFFCECI